MTEDPGRDVRQRPEGKVVGYVPGAFDMFHIGHLNVLKHAAEHCDHLIAGVVSDEMAMRAKGLCPVIPLAERLEIVGVGYRVLSKGPTQLEFQLGYSHPIVFDAPEGITFTVDGPTRLGVAGIDKQLVGEVAANIRKLRKPDPYKGKGVRYAGEHIRRKVGKAGK